MKNIFFTAILIFFSISTFSQEKLSTTTGHIKFFSTTPVEDIEANNYTVTSNLTPSTGTIVFSVPMQGFEFPKAKMQKHYNSKKFLNTKDFPKGKFKGTITNIEDINFNENGSYSAIISGQLTIHGITNNIEETLKLDVNDGAISGMTEFNITLSDYGVVFEKGKPSTNIGKTVKITAVLNFK